MRSTWTVVKLSALFAFTVYCHGCVEPIKGPHEQVGEQADAASSDFDLLMWMTRMYVERGDYSGAEHYVLKSLALAPRADDRYAARTSYAGILCSTGRREEAATQLEMALDQAQEEGQRAEALLQLAECDTSQRNTLLRRIIRELTETEAALEAMRALLSENGEASRPTDLFASAPGEEVIALYRYSTLVPARRLYEVLEDQGLAQLETLVQDIPHAFWSDRARLVLGVYQYQGLKWEDALDTFEDIGHEEVIHEADLYIASARQAIRIEQEYGPKAD